VTARPIILWLAVSLGGCSPAAYAAIVHFGNVAGEICDPTVQPARCETILRGPEPQWLLPVGVAGGVFAVSGAVGVVVTLLGRKRR
jgi:hypothetical protein